MAQSSFEEELFYKAADRIRKNTKLKLTNEQKLELYGYYKQVNRLKLLSSGSRDNPHIFVKLIMAYSN